MVGGNGKSHVSMEDFAIAMVDELERPSHSRMRFTVGYWTHLACINPPKPADTMLEPIAASILNISVAQCGGKPK
ncbi:MAG: hypothetical protein ACTHJP_00250 [Rhodanobacteraceae bacterium]